MGETQLKPIKYPSTPYVDGNCPLIGQYVIVTEKMDGENTNMYRDRIHARSIDSSHHESRSWVKSFHAQIKDSIPSGVKICGENLYVGSARACSGKRTLDARKNRGQSL